MTAALPDDWPPRDDFDDEDDPDDWMDECGYGSREQVDCPRCHEQCGWCSDYRWMHGTLRLPNMTGRKNSRCTIPNMEPEGDGCPLCGGTRKVWRTVSYQRIGTECPHSPTGFHIVDTSMESGPNNCFHCETALPDMRGAA